MGSQVDNVDDLTFVEETQLLPIGWNTTFPLRVPKLQRPAYPDGIVPSLYDTLPTYHTLCLTVIRTKPPSTLSTIVEVSPRLHVLRVYVGASYLGRCA